MEKKKQWMISIWFVCSLTAVTFIIEKLTGFIATYHLQSESVISPIEGGTIIAVEMVIVLLFGLIGFAVPMK